MRGRYLATITALACALIAAPTFVRALDYRDNLEGLTGTNQINVAQVKELQGALFNVGCPDIGAQDGIWGPSSSSQFKAFLAKTGQKDSYTPKMTVAVIIDTLFKPYYNGRICDPLPLCDYNKEIANLMRPRSGNEPIRDTFLAIKTLNADMQTKYKDLPNTFFPPRLDLTPQSPYDGEVMRESVISDYAKAEFTFRVLFRRVVEARNYNCMLCGYLKNWKIATNLLGLKNITMQQLDAGSDIWADAGAVQTSISSNEGIKKKRAENKLSPDANLDSAIVEQKRFRNGLLFAALSVKADDDYNLIWDDSSAEGAVLAQQMMREQCKEPVKDSPYLLPPDE
jgi:hypothetical protein